ncbi:protein TIC [Forsythia ovata]|uniref:Protein TIC n=1 Tax=Forsythia ovata TaxID=205694 RepID=A0ABD1RN28_9LAMI
MSDDDRLKLTYELQYWAKQEFNFFNSNGRKNLAMSDEEIVKHFCRVPVYYSRFSDGEAKLMISHKDPMKSFLGFFFDKADAMAFMDTPSEFGIDPHADSEPLDVAIDYNMANVIVKFIPEASEVKNALQVKKKAGLPHKNFSGVPVFESRNLSTCQGYLSLANEGCLNQKRLVFFKKDDLEKSLAKARAASHDGGSNLIDTETNIEVAALEDIIRAMKVRNFTLFRLLTYLFFGIPSYHKYKILNFF